MGSWETLFHLQRSLDRPNLCTCLLSSVRENERGNKLLLLSIYWGQVR